MIEYYEQITQEEQDMLTEVIQTLFSQTYLLERKYDRRTGRMKYVNKYRICSKHLEFLREYFAIAGITLKENAHMGVIYIQGGQVCAEKLSRLATIYLLVLKLIYDEQMASVSSSSHIVTTLGTINSKAGEFGVLKSLPSVTEMRRTVTLLKKYQMIEPLEALEEMNEQTRIIIYPCINAVLMGDEIRKLLAAFGEEDNLGDETAIQSAIEDLSE